jgi:uncharacterized membrane protein (UPF0127 family)
MFGPFAFALLLVFAQPARAGELPRAQLSVEQHSIHAEVAATQAAKERGLMGRIKLPDDAGMLLVFPQPGRYSLWMKDTLIPLDAAFLDSSGVILSIVTMSPRDFTLHSSPDGTSYALETNAGWFAKRGIKPGASVRGLEKLRASMRELGKLPRNIQVLPTF